MYPNNVEHKRPHLSIFSPIILCKFENGIFLLNKMDPFTQVRQYFFPSVFSAHCAVDYSGEVYEEGKGGRILRPKTAQGRKG